jgi:hypothetical protein
MTRRLANRSERSYYRRNPAAWARDRLGVHLWSKQREIAELLLTHPRVAVQSAHGVGKSFTAALIAAWWVDVHPPGEAIVVSTAPSYEQVHAILWEELRGFHRRGDLPGDIRMDDHWNIGTTQVGMGRRPANHNQHSFQGIHRRYVLVLIDEACGVPEWLWTAADTITTGDECRTLAIGNPDDNSSHFAHVCEKDTGWRRVKISAYDSPNLTGEDVPAHMRQLLVTAGWVRDKEDRWGQQSPLFTSKVRGEWADNESGVIPMSWVYQAQTRWRQWFDDGQPEPAGVRYFGVDVARFGTDRTAIATRQGDTILDVETWAQLDSVQVTDLVANRLRYPRSQAIVDAEGIGGPVVDQLRHAGYSPRPFAAGSMTNRRDITGVMTFPNVRSAMWWNARELLEPHRQPVLRLPPDDDLLAELTGPTWDVKAGNRIVVESKDDMKARLNRSPDSADAVLMALWAEHLGDGRDTNSAGGLDRLTPRDYGSTEAVDSSARRRRRQHTATTPGGFDIQ